MELDRITRNPQVMSGKPCVRAAYPYLEEEDIRQALAYAAWRVEEIN